MNTRNSLRFFNTTGPCNTEEHYMLSPEERLVGAQLNRYIGDKRYWVLHSPHQTGKTPSSIKIYTFVFLKKS